MQASAVLFKDRSSVQRAVFSDDGDSCRPQTGPPDRDRGSLFFFLSLGVARLISTLINLLSKAALVS